MAELDIYDKLEIPEGEVLDIHKDNVLLWEKSIEKTASGNGSIEFAGNRNRALVSAIFKGKSEQKTLAGRNLFDISTVPMDGKYVASKTGALVANASWQHSTYIPVTAGKKYRFVANHTASSNAGMAWYNSSKTYISGVAGGKMQTSDIITAPANAAFARISWAASAGWQDIVWFYDYDKWGADATREEYCGGIPSPNPDYPQPIKSNNSKWELNNGTVDLSTIILNGINGVKDTYDSQTGLLTRRIGILDLATFGDWTISSTNPSQHNREVSNMKRNTTNVIAEKYLFDTNHRDTASQMDDGRMTVPTSTSNGKRIYITSGNGVNPSGKFYFELETPTTEYISPQSITQIKSNNLLRQISGDIANTEAKINYFGRATL